MSARAQQAAPLQAKSASHTVTYDKYSLLIDGKRIYLWSGSFHYWRLPSPSLWKDVLQKMKAAGYNGVEIYFHWGFHSPRPGVYDFSGIRDVDRLLDMARDEGIYVIARPGPYINAETDGGGFPAWLAATAGKPRTTAPEYTAAYKDWLTHIDAIIARHQVTNGTGSVLLYQVENELYTENDDTRRYMQDIADKARADGITVPLTGNHNDNFLTGLGAPQIPGFDSYPLDFDCTQPDRWNKLYDFSSERMALKGTPLFFPEYQGGAFDQWGGAGNAKCRELTGVPFERVFYKANIAAGSTMQNFYMTYGGINWGYLASPGVYTSYDYGAAIEASRKLTAKYDQQKLLGYFVQSVAPLAKTERLPVRPPTQQGLRDDARINPDDGTQFHFVRHADAASKADDTTHVWMNLAASAADGSKTGYTQVPQQPGTALRINGRDAKILLAHYRFGSQTLVYSTSEWMTQLTSGGRDIALLYGRNGEDGETVLRYSAAPRVRVLAGQVASQFDAKAGTLRLNYRHGGLARVLIDGADGNSLLLLLADDAAAATFWQLPSIEGPVLVRGPYLVREAAVSTTDATASLKGDAAQPGELEFFNPGTVKSLSWNGHAIGTSVTPSGSLLAQVDGPLPVTLPSLDHWKTHAGSPEAEPRFDDHAWARANLASTKNPYWDGHSPIWNSDDYGFHHGAVWYRGHFKATGRETGIILGAYMGVHLGNHGIFTAWLNGHYLGSNPSSSQLFNIDPSWLQPGKDNVLAVLVDNMGHNQEEHNGVTKEPHGLYKAAFLGSDAAIGWRIQGSLGGVDTVRGPFNNGGLYGEREGWSLPGFDDASWKDATLPSTAAEPGVQWYGTNVTLDLPPGQDIPVALKIDDASERPYRALIFINGWQVGRYISDVGPQHEFELPAGLLHAQGPNTIAIASWSTAAGGGLGKVSLIVQGNVTTSLKVEDVASPNYRDLQEKLKAASSGR